MLAALAYRAGPRAEALGRQVIETVANGQLGLVYVDLVLSYLQPALVRALEEWMNQQYEYQHPMFRRPWDEGKAAGEAAGEAKGEAKGKAEAILTFLEARGISVPDELADKLLSCTDVKQLDEWARRAAHVESAKELFS